LTETTKPATTKPKDDKHTEPDVGQDGAGMSTPPADPPPAPSRNGQDGAGMS
jgi:hypothetical protein